MPKLNKQQTLDLVATTVANVIAQSTDLFKKDKAPGFEEVLQHRIAAILAPKHGGGTSTKVNDEGDVFCNYFQDYYPANNFNTKLGKPNKDTGVRVEGYKANCVIAETILRKIKSLKAMVSRQVTINFMDKTIDADEMTEILERLDTMTEPKFDHIDDVPTVADVIGLTTPTTTDTEESE